MNFWDQRFAEPGFKYGTAPNAFLLTQAHRLPAAARVLVPGDGEGRNGVWLAEQGHAVQSVDGSGIGLAKARTLAAERGATIATLHADLADWQPAPASADAVVLVFVHLPSALRRDVHRRLAAALVPGGWLVLEGFHPRQLGRMSGGPKDIDMLMPLAALREDFAGLLDEVLGEETETPLDEGPGHKGDAVVTRYVGRRVAPSRP
jgi:SAM-dependent methyltransferase